MISAMKRLIVGTVAMIGFAASANAAFVPATWTDQIAGNTYVSAGNTHWYVHDITDSGFTPFDDFVIDFSLTINLHDEADDGWFTSEAYSINISQWVADLLTIGTDQEVFTSDWTDWTLSNGWTFTGLFELNTAGTLTAGITSLWGDFNVGTSTLVTNGLTKQVPEPGAIALLGLGLLGIGLGRRKLAK